MIRSKVKLTIQNTPLHNYRENGCKRSAQGSLGSFGLTSIGGQYSNAANNQLSFVYVFSIHMIPEIFSLRRRPLEVVGQRENGRARGRHARGEGAPARKAPEIVSTRILCLLLARPFFLVPTTSKRLLRRLRNL